jgi:hypothetical protein
MKEYHNDLFLENLSLSLSLSLSLLMSDRMMNTISLSLKDFLPMKAETIRAAAGPAACDRVSSSEPNHLELLLRKDFLPPR